MLTAAEVPSGKTFGLRLSQMSVLPLSMLSEETWRDISCVNRAQTHSKQSQISI